MGGEWSLVYDGFSPNEEPLREALCTLGNGVFATRGAAEESRASDEHYPGTYLAGGYNRRPSLVAGREIVNEDLVNFPNWLPLTFRVDGGVWFLPSSSSLLKYRQTLDLRRGVLQRALRARLDEERVVAVQSRRIVHMGDPHLAAIEYRIEVESGGGRVEVRSGLDGAVTNWGVARYRQLNGKHLEVLDAAALSGESIGLRVRTNQSRVEMAQVARTRLWLNGVRVALEGAMHTAPEAVEGRFALDIGPGDELLVEKTVAVYTSRDPAISEPLEDAAAAVGRADRFAALEATHARAWDHLWRRFDVEVETAEPIAVGGWPLQLAVRVHTFHSLQTASPNTIGRDVSVPARGLHGEAYRGHIFWDEMYIFPFHTLRAPEVVRDLLLYRVHRLPEARLRAREEGYRGAMFPWQSGSNGREETQVLHLNPQSGVWGPDRSQLQRHVGAAIAWNAWSYIQATGDRVFVRDHLAELLVEIARFWSSLARWDSDTGRYILDGVMGPDEFHEAYPDAVDTDRGGLRNNVYTNVMAVWCIQRAVDALAMLDEVSREQLRATVGLNEAELERWRDVQDKMALPRLDDGTLEQFEGYGKLEDLDWEAYRREYGNIGRLDRILKAEGDSPDRYKGSKQADLCMLFFVLDPDELRDLLSRLGYDMNVERARDTIEYYRKRTTHGSTLSHVVFASILHQLDPRASWAHFLAAMASDLVDTQGGTTPEGIHAAVMASTVVILLRDYLGLVLDDEGVHLRPQLPEMLSRIRCTAEYRGARLSLDAERDAVSVTVAAGSATAVPVILGDTVRRIAPGETETLRYIV